MIEDFFRLLTDAVRYYPKKSLISPLAAPIFSASLSALTLQQVDPLRAVLHYCRDVLSFGTDKPSISEFAGPDGEPFTNPPEVQASVKQLIASQGAILVQRVLTGMMFSFPDDCFPDASGVLMSLFELMPQETANWVEATVHMLPPGTVKPGESERLMKSLSERIYQGDVRKTRVVLQGSLIFSFSFWPRVGGISIIIVNCHPRVSLITSCLMIYISSSLTDFTNSYRRRNVAPREGLGRLEAARFKFSG